jgi:hypothetical protein
MNSDDAVRICRACDRQVEVKWHAHGDPVLWTCPECGLRDELETEDALPRDVRTTDDDLSEEAKKL